MVEVHEVRTQLKGVSTDYLADSEIQQQVVRATNIVNHLKSSEADSALIDGAILAISTWFSYVVYTQMVQRELGEYPALAAIQLAELKSQAQWSLNLISKVPVDIITMMPMTRLTVVAIGDTESNYYEE